MATYNFDNELRRSLSVPTATIRQMLEITFGEIRSVRRSTPDEERLGVDYVFTLPSGREQLLDLKERRKDYKPMGQDDLVLEHIANTTNGQLGWTIDPTKQTDWTCWHWTDTGRFRIVSAHLLRQATLTSLDTWVKDYAMLPQTTKGRRETYDSRALLVPTRQLALALWRQSEGTI